MLNKVILMGRLTRDPDVRRTPSGISVTTFSLAVDRGFKRSDDNPNQQTVDFIEIVTWRNTADFTGKYFLKGMLVVVSGRLQVRRWQDKDGNSRTTYEVVADDCYFAEPKREGSYSAQRDDAPPLPDSNPAPLNTASDNFEEIEDDDGELPF